MTENPGCKYCKWLRAVRHGLFYWMANLGVRDEYICEHASNVFYSDRWFDIGDMQQKRYREKPESKNWKGRCGCWEEKT